MLNFGNNVTVRNLDGYTEILYGKIILANVLDNGTIEPVNALNVPESKRDPIEKSIDSAISWSLCPSNMD